MRGRFNDSTDLDLIFDTGADICVLYPSAGEKGAALTFDGVINNTGTGGTTRRQVSRDNRLEVADCLWMHEPVLYVEKQADHADGIVGYRVFEDRVVEFDYDRMLMTIRETAPQPRKGMAQAGLTRSGTLMSLDAALESDGTESVGPFLLDTGGTGTLIVNQAFASDHGLRGRLRKLGTGEARGVGPAVIHLDCLLLPSLSLAGFELRDVPIVVEVAGTDNPAPPGARCAWMYCSDST
ncbi:MAG: aspartyl protease family protein [Phycisphaerales bacterium]|nr:aspartyl protease family protein [Phycisphaerales bacterium]